jgi:hypothetical protein
LFFVFLIALIVSLIDCMRTHSGGTADRTLRFWDTSTGACLNSIDTKSQVSFEAQTIETKPPARTNTNQQQQVCSVLWSPHYRELVSSHGYSQNQLCVWKYPSMTKVCELTGHSSRVLHMAMSPDGETGVFSIVVLLESPTTIHVRSCIGERRRDAEILAHIRATSFGAQNVADRPRHACAALDHDSMIASLLSCVLPSLVLRLCCAAVTINLVSLCVCEKQTHIFSLHSKDRRIVFTFNSTSFVLEEIQGTRGRNENKRTQKSNGSTVRENHVASAKPINFRLIDIEGLR